MMPDAIRTLENSSGNGVPASIAALKNFADDEVVEELNRRFQNSRRFPQRLAITFALCGVRICQSGFPDDSSGQYQRRGYCKSDDWHSARHQRRLSGDCKLLLPTGRRLERLRSKVRFAIAAMGLGDTSLAEDVCETEGRDSHVLRSYFH
ncbi:MAG UNVERIFIED_CONTAM: hypothetical protein LVR18_38145 [Planctomycetaceae bacterium]|jgi:hypothetical protein